MSIDPVSAAGGALGAVGCIVAGAVNTGLQTAAAQKISKSEQQLDYANAAYTARLEMLGAHTEALQALQDFDALAREQISHASDLAELDSMITQELARRSALLRELERIRLNAETGRAAVARRYYADPVHSQRAEAQLLRADIAFRRAQRWAFFVQRALEYKWNKDFVYSFVGGRDYDRNGFVSPRSRLRPSTANPTWLHVCDLKILGFRTLGPLCVRKQKWLRLVVVGTTKPDHRPVRTASHPDDLAQ